MRFPLRPNENIAANRFKQKLKIKTMPRYFTEGVFAANSKRR